MRSQENVNNNDIIFKFTWFKLIHFINITAIPSTNINLDGERHQSHLEKAVEVTTRDTTKDVRVDSLFPLLWPVHRKRRKPTPVVRASTVRVALSSLRLAAPAKMAVTCRRAVHRRHRPLLSNCQTHVTPITEMAITIITSSSSTILWDKLDWGLAKLLITTFLHSSVLTLPEECPLTPTAAKWSPTTKMALRRLSCNWAFHRLTIIITTNSTIFITIIILTTITWTLAIITTLGRP